MTSNRIVDQDLIEAEIDDVLKSLGSNEVQRCDAALMLPGHVLEMRDGQVVIKQAGVPFNTPEGHAWIIKNKGHLVPPPHDANKADIAFTSSPPNMTHRQNIVKQVGLAEANRLAREVYGLSDIFDRKAGTAPDGRSDKTKSKSKNPWLDDSAEGLNRRIAYIETFGAKSANGMAKAANRTITGQPLRGRFIA